MTRTLCSWGVNRMKRLTFLAVTTTALACANLGQESWIITEEDEVELGARFNQDLLAEMPEYKGNEAVLNYVRSIGEEIARVSDRPPNDVLKYHFTVVDSDEINAFAIPGGYVYVTKGLLKAATSSAEVATVLGHEVGHIAARHGVKSMEIQFGAALLGQLLGSGEIAKLVQEAISLGTGLVFDQDQEREADKLGVDFALRAGWNPWGMVDFFEYLQTIEPKGDDLGPLTKLGELFSSHPPTRERLENVTTQIQAYGVDRNASGYRWESDTKLSQIKAML